MHLCFPNVVNTTVSWKLWDLFHQTVIIGAFWGIYECFRFWRQRSKFKVTLGPTRALILFIQTLALYKSFPYLLTLVHFASWMNASGFGIKGQSSRSRARFLQHPLFALLTQCLENYWTEFFQTFIVDAFLMCQFLGSKGQGHGINEGPIGRSHTALNAMHRVLILVSKMQHIYDNISSY